MNRIERWRDDLLAGLTGAAAGAPQAMGFALLAGVAPIYGLYSAAIPTIVGALSSSSTYATIAPTNVLMLLTASSLAGFDSPLPHLFTLTLLIGVFLVLFAALRMARLTRLVSNATSVGFVSGAALLIILGQLQHITGTQTPSKGNALERFVAWLSTLPQTDGQTLVIGLFTITCIILLQRTRLRSMAVLIAIVSTSIFISAATWSDLRLVRDLSPIPTGLPPPMLPPLEDVSGLIGGALAVALLAALQTAALAESVREPDGSVSQLDRDFFGQGLANIAGSFFQCLPTSASLSRTAVNVRAGAKTRLANAFSGVLIIAMLLSLGSLVERIALAALAGQLIVAGISLFDWKMLRLIWNVDTKSRTILIVTLGSTLVLPLEFSIYLGIGLSLLFYVISSSTQIHMERLVPTADGHFQAEAVPAQLPNAEPVILNVSGSLFHASLKRLEELLPSPDRSCCPVVILRLRDHENLGSTGVRVLLRYSARLNAQGGRLYLAGIHPHISVELKRTSMLEKIGTDSVFESTPTIFGATEQALESARAWIAEQQNLRVRQINSLSAVDDPGRGDVFASHA